MNTHQKEINNNQNKQYYTMITIGHRSIINTFKLIFAMIENYELSRLYRVKMTKRYLSKCFHRFDKNIIIKIEVIIVAVDVNMSI